MSHEAFISSVTLFVELAGVVVLLVGGIVATGIFVRAVLRSSLGAAYQAYRANLGRAILLGLEILIIADIIGTIAIQPTLYNIGVLALIVLIRTFLSFALEIEISGRLPWRSEPTEGSATTGGV